ncbi:hypothetical protein KSE_23430 [Kitasatospora setae KM-6054]|uniref:Uncharacterized protein n=1 Tax=Kitasatospora setae (strain ATCC 33774 / DSM 43861 / JCM 3304 / KCC A-0304 / NBRC 14216 / KM-6054) TaxID=452652 RepID=E4NAD1_KITSK|nr:hypothetical protein KSE_23430 [Kitasatospora setae KM-6054]
MRRDPVDPAKQSHKTVHVPKANLLTVRSLAELVTGPTAIGGE